MDMMAWGFGAQGARLHGPRWASADEPLLGCRVGWILGRMETGPMKREVAGMRIDRLASL